MQDLGDRMILLKRMRLRKMTTWRVLDTNTYAKILILLVTINKFA